jgi:hypothetical protein
LCEGIDGWFGKEKLGKKLVISSPAFLRLILAKVIVFASNPNHPLVTKLEMAVSRRLFGRSALLAG